MICRALVTFGGVVSMRKDEVREITDKKVASDLLRAGYVQEIKKEVKTQKGAKK